MKIPRYDFHDELMPMDVDDAAWRAHNLLAATTADPNAVNYSREQLEELIARMEAFQGRREPAPNERMARMLKRPADVLSDRAQWPRTDDLGSVAAQTTGMYRAWILGRAMRAGGGWEAAARWSPIHGAPLKDDRHTIALQWLLKHASMPYPVGKACPEFADGFPSAAARELMPFDDDVHAALVLPLPAGERTVMLFFMAVRGHQEVLLEGEWGPLPVPDEDEDEKPGFPVWIIDGKDVRSIPPRPRKCGNVMQRARSWWKSMAGLPIRSGRPPGSRTRIPRQLIDALIAYKAEHGPFPPSCENFLEYVGIERTQWQRLIDDWDITWVVLRKAIYGNAKRKRNYNNHG